MGETRFLLLKVGVKVEEKELMDTHHPRNQLHHHQLDLKLVRQTTQLLVQSLREGLPGGVQIYLPRPNIYFLAETTYFLFSR